MPWTPFLPPTFTSAGKAPPPPVSMSTTEGKGRFKPRLCLSIRAEPAAEIGWWTAGATVAVAIGSGEYAGMLRVTPGGPFALRSSGGKDAKKAATMLVLPLLPGMARAVRPSLGVEHDYGDDWLEVTLPAWEVDAAAAEQAVHQVVAPPAPPVAVSPPAKPFRGLGSTTPDPMVRKMQEHVARKVGAFA